MCLAVYLGTTQPIPASPWRDGEPFGVDELHPIDDPVRAHLGMSHVYELRAWEGCGCGFEHATWLDLEAGDDDRADQERNAASLGRLAALLRDVLTHEHPVRLYSCWIGEQVLAVRSTRVVPVTHFDAPVFALKELELLLVEP